ncbi:MAG TPA: acyl-CoA thioesterase [Pusillimonas sp.]|uniref:acyl-CoA thioesterase n=1 Tax=unclassified Pusillimonas TaxID=2640016 RepID=UPI00262C0235|nr:MULTISPECIES: acyl-CoA thioesterase [unclassified Pusillimonas]HLU20706.1 acyl-CoA thioesterase [Pusillimonas sp.]
MLHDEVSAVPLAGHIFECVLPLRWGDQDALHHVNNTLYFRYVEEARALLYLQAGMPVPGEYDPVLVHASCDFLRPLLYPGTAVVKLVFVKFGRTSMEYDFVIERQDDPGVVYARGKNITVNTESATGQPCPWFEHQLAAYARCFKPEEQG